MGEWRILSGEWKVEGRGNYINRDIIKYHNKGGVGGRRTEQDADLEVVVNPKLLMINFC